MYDIFLTFVSNKTITNMSISTISLSGMEFHAYHGCFDLEKVVGNKFIVDVDLGVDVEEAALSDDLSQAVNYVEVYEAIKGQMMISSDIIENVAWRIGETILKEFSQVVTVEVKLAKLAPPLTGRVFSVSTTIKRKRE